MEIAKKNITNNVKKTYLNLLLLKEWMKNIQENLDIYEKRYKDALETNSQGMKSDIDLLSSKVDYENFKPEFINKNNDYNKTLRQFKQLLGLKKDVDIELTGNIVIEEITINAEDLIKKYLFDNLDIKSLKVQINSAQNSRNIAISALAPSFSLGYLLDPDFQKDPTNNNWFGSASYNTDNWQNQRGALSFTLSIPLSSFSPLGSEQVNIVKAQYAVEIKGES